MRSAYRVLAILIAAGVFIQAASIAFAWFDVISALEGGAVLDKDMERNAGHNIHGMNGMMVIPLLSLILFIVSFFAKIPSGVKWAGFILLAVVVQVALAITAFSVPAVGALHGLNALIIFSLAVMAALKARNAVAPEASDNTDRVGADAG